MALFSAAARFPVSGELPELLLLLCHPGSPVYHRPPHNPAPATPKICFSQPKNKDDLHGHFSFPVSFFFFFFDQNLTFQASLILFPLRLPLLRIRTTIYINTYLIFFYPQTATQLLNHNWVKIPWSKVPFRLYSLILQPCYNFLSHGVVWNTWFFRQSLHFGS